jgi:signal transduction histidine kinase
LEFMTIRKTTLQTLAPANGTTKETGVGLSNGTPIAANPDDRVISAMRLVMVASAFVILLIDPTEPNRLILPTYITLVLYLTYCLTLRMLVGRQVNLPFIRKWAHWIDVGWFTLLVGLSTGTNSLFFFGYFFAILVASFRHGFAEGLRVSFASVGLFVFASLLTAVQGVGFELNRFLLRPTYLLLLGYMIAYWGGFETTLKRRLSLLREISMLANPRFGVEYTLTSLLRRLLTHYGASSSFLVTKPDEDGTDYRIRHVEAEGSGSGEQFERLPQELGELLLSLPPQHIVIYGIKRPIWQFWRVGTIYAAYDVNLNPVKDEGREASRTIAATLDAASFLSVPVEYHKQVVGRLYLTSHKARVFTLSDAEFARQVLSQMSPSIDNIRLVDRLTFEATEQASKRIARDLHDSFIQPYIGLQMGLAAVQQSMASPNQDRKFSDVKEDMDRLVALAREGVAELRAYTRGLRENATLGESLPVELERFISKFSDVTGIEVELRVDPDLRVHNRVGSEVLQIVAEGLSNIRRHTQAEKAAVIVERKAGKLHVRIENEHSGSDSPRPFTPRSISERTTGLGGHATVEQGTATSVVIEIPL